MFCARGATVKVDATDEHAAADGSTGYDDVFINEEKEA
jgi:hypothetical protein